MNSGAFTPSNMYLFSAIGITNGNFTMKPVNPVPPKATYSPPAPAIQEGNVKTCQTAFRIAMIVFGVFSLVAAGAAALALTSFSLALPFIAIPIAFTVTALVLITLGLIFSLAKPSENLPLEPSRSEIGDLRDLFDEQEKPLIRYLVLSGGGAKGIVFLGAFQVFIEDPLFFNSIHRLVGTSVGAVTAAIVASGASVEQLRELEKVDFKKIVGSRFVHNDGEQLILFIRQQIIQAIRTQLQKNPISPNLLEQLSEEQQQIYQELLIALDPEQPLNEITLNFEMLDLLYRLDPIHFKKLSITATCTDKKASVAAILFNAKESPKMDVAVACRISAGLPLFFKPAKIKRSQLHTLSITPQEAEISDATFSEELEFIDGGWLLSIPTTPIEKKAENGKKDIETLRRETLVLVFEKARDANTPSIFDWDQTLPETRGAKKVLIDDAIPSIGNFSHLPGHLETKHRLLQNLKNCYLRENILSFAVDLDVIDFEQAAQEHEKYSAEGQESARECLRRLRPRYESN